METVGVCSGREEMGLSGKGTQYLKQLLLSSSQALQFRRHRTISNTNQTLPSQVTPVWLDDLIGRRRPKGLLSDVSP